MSNADVSLREGQAMGDLLKWSKLIDSIPTHAPFGRAKRLVGYLRAQMALTVEQRDEIASLLESFMQTMDEQEASMGHVVKGMDDRLRALVEENEAMRRQLKRFAWFYDVNDCKDRRPYEGIEILVSELKACRDLVGAGAP